MRLIRKISPLGNSSGIILPHTVLEMLKWEAGMEVDLIIEDNRLTMVRHENPVPPAATPAARKRSARPSR